MEPNALPAPAERKKSSQSEYESSRGWYVDEYLQYLAVEKNLAKRTIVEYRDDLELFFEFFRPMLAEGLTLNQIDNRTVREFLTFLKLEHNYTAVGLNRKIAALRGYFHFLEQEKHIEASPMNAVLNAKKGLTLPKVLSQSDMDVLLTYAENRAKQSCDWKDYRDAAIIELFYATGMRLAELSTLNTADINFDDYSLRLLGKGNKQRIAFMNQSACDALQAYLKVRPKTKSPAVFLNRFNQRFSRRGIEIMFDKVKEEAGVFKDASPHTLRHSFATHLLENGADVVTIKELLGHANLATTQIYTNLSRAHMRQIYDEKHPRR